MTINLSTILGAITIPTPVAYDPEYPHKNQEGFYYACLQILQQLSTLEFEFADNTADSALVQAVKDLQYNDNVIDFGVFRIELRGRYKET